MNSVGRSLKAARLELGISLEEIRTKTRIGMRVLTAIEHDDLGHFGGPFFYISFVRQFADAVKLPYADLAELMDIAVKKIPPPIIAVSEECASTAKVRPLEVKVKSSGGVRWIARWIWSVASLVLTMVGCTALYSFWQGSEANLRAAVERPIQAIHRTLTPAARPAFHVELSAVEATWLSIVADGKNTFSGILAPAETKVLEGYNVARVRLANAGTVSMIFNGKRIGSVGPRGEARIAIFRKNGYEIIQPSPRVALAVMTVKTE